MSKWSSVWVSSRYFTSLRLQTKRLDWRGDVVCVGVKRASRDGVVTLYIPAPDPATAGKRLQMDRIGYLMCCKPLRGSSLNHVKVFLFLGGSNEYCALNNYELMQDVSISERGPLAALEIRDDLSRHRLWNATKKTKKNKKINHLKVQFINYLNTSYGQLKATFYEWVQLLLLF